MLRGACRLSALARSAAGRQLSPSAPVHCSSSSSIAQQSSQTVRHELTLFSLLRAHATVAATPGSSPALSPDLQAEIDHATGMEREELIGEAEEAAAIIESFFDERLVGCFGGIGEEEHDVVWFKLKRDTGHECSVCGQVFKVKLRPITRACPLIARPGG